MDHACYCSTNNVIVGVRGGRAFQCDVGTGAINLSTGSQALPDFQQFGLSPSTVCYDSGTNSCFAACWNTPSFNTSTGFSIRQITKINPLTLQIQQVIDAGSLFGLSMQILMQMGLGFLKSSGGQIYGMGADSNVLATVFRFQANNPAGSHEFHHFGGEYMSFALPVVGGNQRIYWNAVGGQDVEWWDFGTSSHGNGGVDTRNRLSIETALGALYIPEEFQFIDIYDTTGTFSSQMDTQRTNFNGVGIALNPFNGLLYVAGGADNTVAVINPATNTFTHNDPGSRVQAGFDLPFRFVFCDPAKGGKNFAVQQGATALRIVN